MELPVIPAYLIAIMALNSAGVALYKWMEWHWVSLVAYFCYRVLPPLYVAVLYFIVTALDLASSPLTPYARLGFFMIFLSDAVESLHMLGSFILRKVKM